MLLAVPNVGDEEGGGYVQGKLPCFGVILGWFGQDRGLESHLYISQLSLFI